MSLIKFFENMIKFFLTVFMINFLWLTVVGQDLEQKVSLKFENTPLSEVLDYLSNVYSINFFYGNGQIPLKQKVTIEAMEKPLSDVLNELCESLQIQHKVIEGYVVLRRNDDKRPLPSTIPNATNSINENDKAEIVDKKDDETTAVNIQRNALKSIPKKNLGYKLMRQSEIRISKPVYSDKNQSSKPLVIGKKVNLRFGPILSHDHYQFNFKEPENGDQSFTTEFNYSLGLSFYLDMSDVALQFSSQYTTKNFSYQYNFRFFDPNDPVSIPKETLVDLDYINIPILFHYHFIQKRQFKLSGTVGGLASFLIGKSEETSYENNKNREETNFFADNTNGTLFSGFLGIRPAYKIAPGTELILMPYYQHYFNKVNSDAMEKNTRQWGVAAELLFKI